MQARIPADEAYFYKLMILCGFSGAYRAWLDGLLEAQDPLDELVTELAFCTHDAQKSVQLLGAYCRANPFDPDCACDRVRAFLKEAYFSKKMDVPQVLSTARRFVRAHEHEEHLSPMWENLSYLSDYAALAADGFLEQETFNRAFEDFLVRGDYEDPFAHWSAPQQKPSLFARIKNRIWNFLLRF